MKRSEFLKLSPTHQVALVIAMHVRNEMEDFHVAHLDDSQMKELNPIVRKAIIEALRFYPVFGPDEGDEAAIDYLVKMIPEYWEIPE